MIRPTAAVWTPLVFGAFLIAGCVGQADQAGPDVDDDVTSDTRPPTDADPDTGVDPDVDADPDADPPDVDPDVDPDAEPDSGTETPVGCLHLWEGQQSAPVFAPIGPRLRGESWTVASAGAFDLDGDGCEDFIIGSGLEQGRFSANLEGYGLVTAISGATGQLLWQADAPSEIFTAPTITTGESGRTLVVMAGRGGSMVALEPETGASVWQVDPGAIVARDEPFNFYTPLVVEDVNDDGVPDLVNVYGGDAAAPAGAPRDASWLVVIDGATGAVLGRRATPDGGESYTSPILLERGAADGSTSTAFLFGTGGETLPGSLWVATVADLMDPDPEPGPDWARHLLDGHDDKGFIAPPLLADLNGDGVRDVLVSAFGGRVSLLAGPDLVEDWHVTFPDHETSITGAVTRLPDGSAGVVVLHNDGVFPMYTGATYTVLRGVDGSEVVSRTTGFPFASSPVTVDLDGDGVDEVVMTWTEVGGHAITGLVRVENLVTGVAQEYEVPFGPTGTPLVHRAAGHDHVELALVGMATDMDDWHILPPDWVFERVSLAAQATGPVTWGAYLGTCGLSWFPCPE